jgi:hypothetical protein
MNSRRKSLFPRAAIALIGLAGASVAIAQTPVPPGPPAPPPFTCAAGESAFKDGNGTNDSFAGTADPKPHPSAGFIAAVNLVPATNIYDQTASNYHFGETFTFNLQGQVTKLRLTTRLKGNSADANNDGITFSTSATFTPGHFGFALSTLVPGWPAGGAKLFWFDFALANPTTVQVNSGPNLGPLPAGYSAAAFLGALGTPNTPLHVYVEDDTSVDFIQIEGCYKPYDLVATKKHDGSTYTLDVTNAGAPISPSGSIQVVEVVPPGLTIGGIGAPNPWTCTGSFPMTGPDAFTCTYPINAVIATGQHLPQIFLKTDGTPECPNCMRAHLYLQAVFGGQKPVDEVDMKNNASCVK